MTNKEVRVLACCKKITEVSLSDIKLPKVSMPSMEVPNF